MLFIFQDVTENGVSNSQVQEVQTLDVHAQINGACTIHIMQYGHRPAQPIILNAQMGVNLWTKSQSLP